MTFLKRGSAVGVFAWHGRQKGGLGPPDFELFSKKSFFLVLRGKNQISPLLAPPAKILLTPMQRGNIELRLSV